MLPIVVRPYSPERLSLNEGEMRGEPLRQERDSVLFLTLAACSAQARNVGLIILVEELSTVCVRPLTTSRLLELQRLALE